MSDYSLFCDCIKDKRGVKQFWNQCVIILLGTHLVFYGIILFLFTHLVLLVLIIALFEISMLGFLESQKLRFIKRKRVGEQK